MKRIVLKHLSGSRAGQVEEFPLEHFQELTIGRDPSCAVAYDPNKDDLVSRNHAKITRDPSDPTVFSLADLGSRNGSFVNKQRITGSARIVPGDIIQIGPGGPEFQFDLEPRPEGAMPATRVAGMAVSSAGSIARTRVSDTGGQVTAQGMGEMRPGVGKTTVERMIAQSSSTSKKYTMFGIAAVVLIVAVVAAVLLYQNYMSKSALESDIRSTKEKIAESTANVPPMTAAQIAQAFTKSVVYIECGWKLIYTKTGGQVYHRYVDNEYKDKDGNKVPIIDDGRKSVAAYFSVSESKTEPDLVLAQNNRPIGGELSGSGFVVTSDGFILTNRHVAATWNDVYRLPEDADPGVMIERGEIVRRRDGSPVLVRAPRNWVPSRTQQIEQQLQGGMEGRNDYLNVTFAKQELRIPAQLARVSDRHDVAMLKIQVPEPVNKVDLYDNYDAIKPGESSIVMGYPGISPDVYGVVRSKDWGNPDSRVRVIPDPTVSVGNVGRILRGKGEGSEIAQFSQMGDVYQLAVTGTSPGSSGGPVFDDRGRVIAIYFARRSEEGGASVSFAVPVRYGKELMSATPDSR